MFFIHPEILWGLTAVLIPLIIHLFNFRRYRKLPFSNIEFLKNITRQTRKQNKLKHLVVLLLRMAAVALIVIAFAGPRFDKTNKINSSKVKTVYIDNSFSMMAEGENGMLFENARRLASNLVKSSGRDERYLLQTNDYYSGKMLLSIEEVLKEIDRLKITSATRQLSSVAHRQYKLLNKINGVESFWFSDFQQYSADITDFDADSVNNYYFFPLAQVQNKNIYIDSCYFSKPLILPGKQAELKVVLMNGSEAAYENVPLTLIINGTKKAVTGVDLPANKKVEVSLSFTTDKGGWQSGKLTIEDYPITFDDVLFFVFEVNSRLKVLDIFSEMPNPYFSAFYESDTVFAFDKVSYLKIDPSAFADYSLIILDRLPEISSGLSAAILRFLNDGGNVLLVLDTTNSSLTSGNILTKQLKVGILTKMDSTITRVKGIKTSDDLFKNALAKVPENAGLPNVNAHYLLKYGVTSGTESLITLLNGDDFFIRKKINGGSFFMITAPVDKQCTDFAFNPLFVPVMFGTAITSDKKATLFHFIGKDDKIDAPITTNIVGEKPFLFKLQNSDYSFFPGQQKIGSRISFFPYDGITKAGIYDIFQDDSLSFSMAFNYSRKESQMKYFDEPMLDSLLKSSPVLNYTVLDGKVNNVQEVINQQQKGAQIWKLFIIFALLFLLVEVVMLRWWK